MENSLAHVEIEPDKLHREISKQIERVIQPRPIYGIDVAMTVIN